jgi:hypothetical protein
MLIINIFSKDICAICGPFSETNVVVKCPDLAAGKQEGHCSPVMTGCASQ